MITNEDGRKFKFYYSRLRWLRMENNGVNVTSVELQRCIQKLDKLEKMINPNSKKSLILWEEDDAFKNLISDIKDYAMNCETSEFPIELLDKLKALQKDATNQIIEGTSKIVSLNEQAKTNLELSRTLSTMYISAMAANPVPESEEYAKAEKTIKSKISNLENSVHITIDLERTTSKASALEYIKAEIVPAIDRLQAEYDAKYVIVDQEPDEEVSLALRKTFKEKMYDAIVKPFASLFKKKSKAK